MQFMRACPLPLQRLLSRGGNQPVRLGPGLRQELRGLDPGGLAYLVRLLRGCFEQLVRLLRNRLAHLFDLGLRLRPDPLGFPFQLCTSPVQLLASPVERSGTPLRSAVLLGGSPVHLNSPGGGLLLGLLLVIAGPYRVLGPVVDLFSAGRTITSLRVDDLPGHYLSNLATVALQIGGALLILAFANRALRRGTARPVFGGGVPLAEEPGWALPFAALAHLLTPLTPRPWLAAFRRARASSERRLAGARTLVRRVEQRYYLGLIVLATIGVVLLAAVEVGR